MCGIVGILSHKPVATELYDSLIQLQHRGQDAAGIMTAKKQFQYRYGQGLVRDIFTLDDMQSLNGNMGIAHTRYPTSGGYSHHEIQPFWIGSPYGIAIAHNGNLVNTPSLNQWLKQERHRHLNTDSDSESLLHVLADGFSECHKEDHEDSDAFFEHVCHAVQHVIDHVKGSYSIVGMVIGKGMLAFRDPHGIRPLCIGSRQRGDQTDWIVASETTPFFSSGFDSCGDIAAGEVVFTDLDGRIMRRQLTNQKFHPCVFEYVYFARPDAALDDVSVYRARLRMGQNLAKRWKQVYPDIIPDIVVPVPYSANTAALSFAAELNVRYTEGLYKNPFIGRTFIMPGTTMRKRSVRYKLSPQFHELKDKKVLLVDDSIVRGTTSKKLIKVVRDCGSKEIYFASTCPPIKHPCYYGIDIPTEDELLAHHMDLDAIKAYLGVDALLYQTQDDLVEAVARKGKFNIDQPCKACMDGQYICGKAEKPRKKDNLGNALI